MPTPLRRWYLPSPCFRGKAKQHLFLDLPMSVVLDPTEDAETYAGAGTKGRGPEAAAAAAARGGDTSCLWAAGPAS